MMPLLKYLGVGSTPWSPLARGRKFHPLTRRSQKESQIHELMPPDLARPLSRAYETVRSVRPAYPSMRRHPGVPKSLTITFRLQMLITMKDCLVPIGRRK